MKIIHTSSGSQLVYEKLGKERQMMELPKALKDDQARFETVVKTTEGIKGYGNLSVHEIEAINFIKYMGIEIGKMCDKVDQMHDIDKRWFVIGRTNLQQGLMALTRAIAKPETF